jgi:hypothetical protein
MNKRTGRNRRRARARRRVFESEAAADVSEVESLKAKPKSLARRWKKKSHLRTILGSNFRKTGRDEFFWSRGGRSRSGILAAL